MEHSIRGVQQARTQALQDIKKNLAIFPTDDEETIEAMR